MSGEPGTPGPNERDDADRALHQLAEQLLDLLTTSTPGQPIDGAHLIIRMVPRDLADDPRIIELIQYLADRANETPAEHDPAEVLPGAIVPADDVLQHDVKDAVTTIAGPKLDKQNREADEARERGEPRAKPVDQQVEIRVAFQDAVRSINHLASLCADCAGKQIRNGCTWWQNELPEPLKTVMTGAATAGSVAALGAAPITTAIVAVTVVALVSRRRSRDEDLAE
ncbi:MAG: hypothetical protein ACIAQU_01460 [Phycisphaerales bacterium JB064]